MFLVYIRILVYLFLLLCIFCHFISLLLLPLLLLDTYFKV